jgi:type I restriction-modification system DNA methylase subunit
MTYDEAKRTFVKTLEQASYHKRTEDVFFDFLKVSVIAFTNACETQPKAHKEREQEYRKIASQYTNEQFELFPQMLGYMAIAFENHLGDFLGEVYMASMMGSNKAGQFFTPYNLSAAMARLNFNKQIFEETIRAKGFVRADEPSCGSGGTLVGLIEAMINSGINPQKYLLVEAQDIDPRCAYMCFLTMCMLHIPARIKIGDTLSMNYHTTMDTPALVTQWMRFRHVWKR